CVKEAHPQKPCHRLRQALSDGTSGTLLVRPDGADFQKFERGTTGRTVMIVSQEVFFISHQSKWTIART
ncbi:MAG TPA: hypothetical protein VGT44_17010, partial [Ktedonobacteraceae bacterium]|nr:hypothetical protein [Ktedonobacteraceae bacterium]